MNIHNKNRNIAIPNNKNRLEEIIQRDTSRIEKNRPHSLAEKQERIKQRKNQ